MRCPLPSRPFPDPRTCKRATHASKHRQTATAWGHHAISGKEGGARESKGEQERERERFQGDSFTYLFYPMRKGEGGHGWKRGGRPAGVASSSSCCSAIASSLPPPPPPPPAIPAWDICRPEADVCRLEQKCRAKGSKGVNELTGDPAEKRKGGRIGR